MLDLGPSVPHSGLMGEDRHRTAVCQECSKVAKVRKGLCCACYSRARLTIVDGVCRSCAKPSKMVSKGRCIKCYQRDWQTENKEHVKDRARVYAREWRAANPERVKTNARKSYAANPDRARAYARACAYKKAFGLTLEDVARMHEMQGGLCALCKSPIPAYGQNAPLDHDHATGKPRALLCRFCNTSLGVVEKLGFDWVLEAFEYVQRHRATPKAV